MNILKRILPLVCIASLGTLKAQIPNGSFETWKKDTAYTLQVWDVTGSGSGTTKKTVGQSGSALYFNNVVNGSATEYSTAGIASSNSFGLGPAFAWTKVCDSLRIRYRCGLGTDSATISAGLNRLGEDVPAFLAVAFISGTQNTWKTLSVPFLYMGVPDSVPDSAWVFITPHDDTKNLSGWLEIDNIEFVKGGSALVPNIPNGDFDDWNMATVDYPVNWVTTDRYASKAFGVNFAGSSVAVSDAHSGTKAMKLTRGSLGFINIPGVIISDQNLSEPNEDKPAFPISARYASFRGYYKLAVSTSDRIIATANLFYQGNVVGTATFTDSVSKTSYTLFNEDFEYDPSFSGVPDSAVVNVGIYNRSSDAPDNSTSWAIVDELSFSQYFASTSNLLSNDYKIYPNPASSKIYIAAQNREIKIADYSITDITGKLLLKGKLEAATGSFINTQSLSNGYYFITLKSKNGVYTQKIAIQQ